jgi:hypothetical protein
MSASASLGERFSDALGRLFSLGCLLLVVGLLPAPARQSKRRERSGDALGRLFLGLALGAGLALGSSLGLVLALACAGVSGS